MKIFGGPQNNQLDPCPNTHPSWINLPPHLGLTEIQTAEFALPRTQPAEWCLLEAQPTEWGTLIFSVWLMAHLTFLRSLVAIRIIQPTLGKT